MTIFRLVAFILLAILPLSGHGTVNSVVSCKDIFAPSANQIDGIAGWGTKLLPAKVFQRNNRYQQNVKIIMNSDSTGITPYWKVRGHGFKGKFDSLLEEWNAYFFDSLARTQRQYGVTHKGINHSLTLLELRSSGTEANNYFYELAAFAFRKRTGKPAKRPQLLFFASPETGLFPYGGTSGRSAEMSIRYTKKQQETLDNYLVPGVQTKYFENIPPAEKIRLETAENEAIRFIRQQVNNEILEIGGIILEPISVSKGLHFFRREFLLRLRTLADELGIPIMADEIFTGGGRTGQFWAFQHYQGFYPDVISFGKGLELKGVGWIRRQPVDAGGQMTGPLMWDFPTFNPYKNGDPSKWSYDHMRLDNTAIASASDVARALVVMETIKENKLVESARTNGKSILESTRAKATSLGLLPEDIQGIGMVFHFSNYIDRLFPKDSVVNYEGRVTPYLTTKKSDWPELLP